MRKPCTGNQPYLFLKWAILSKLAGVRFAIVSVGVDILSARASSLFFALSCRLASYVSFRDSDSLAEAYRRRLVRQAVVVPDLAYSYPLVAAHRNGTSPCSVVGISPICHESWPTSASNYDAYLETLASFSSRLVERGYRVVFFASQLTMDRPVISQILERMKPDNVRAETSVPEISTVDELCEVIDQCDIIVASRLHAILISHLRRRPVIAAFYGAKTRSLMTDMHHESLSLDAERLAVSDLEQTLLAVESRYDELVAQIDTEIEARRRRVEEQYDWLFQKHPESELCARDIANG